LRTRSRIAALAAIAIVGSSASASAVAAPCSPQETGVLEIGASHEFVSTRTDNGFGAQVSPGTGLVSDESIDVSAQPPAVVTKPADGGTILDAPNGGPVTLMATWEQRAPGTGAAPCSASGSAVVTVVPVRLPVVRQEKLDAPAAVGPTVTWPCPDASRVTDAASTIVLRYEKGLKRAPGPTSPALRMALDDPCERNLHRGVSKSNGPSLGASNEYAFDPTRYGAVVHAQGAGDLRLALDIKWGEHEALRADYAMVFAGRRQSDGKAVFITTTPARAAAVARRYTRQRAGRPYRSPDQVDFRHGRNYTLTVSGSYTATWAAGRGTPGEPGCGFVRESGSETARFKLKGDNVIRGTSDRTYAPISECAAMPKLGGPGSIECLPHITLHGAGTAEFLSAGALMWTGRRARGPRLSLFLYLDRGGDSCPGWEGIFSTPALYLDGSAAGVSKLRVGARKTVRVTQKTACVDQVAGTQGDASACVLSATADVVVRRTS
jgi:hypothetical protein